MTHLDEEQLILHYYGEDAAEAPTADAHLGACSECRSRFNAIRLVLNTVDSASVPERDAAYGAEVWRRIQSKVGRRSWFWFSSLRPWMLIPAAAALMFAAFLAGRLSQAPHPPAAANNVRERILMVAVGDHLDRSQMVLAELSNAPDGQGRVDISNEQQLAEDLLDDNRLYRQTAHSAGDAAVASVLDDLERVLLEVAHSPSQVSSGQLEQFQRQIRESGLLFKVRVVGSQVRQRESPPPVDQAERASKKL